MFYEGVLTTHAQKLKQKHFSGHFAQRPADLSGAPTDTARRSAANTATRRIGGTPQRLTPGPQWKRTETDSGCTPSPRPRFARKSITAEFLESTRFLTPTFLSVTRFALL